MMFMGLFWIFAFVAIIYLAGTFSVDNRAKVANAKSAAEILADRYAGGEISREEFNKIRNDLNSCTG